MDNLKPWEQRPVEVANLLNPAFIAVLLHSTFEGFQSVNYNGMPYTITFLSLPLVLHKPTRDILPRTTATKLTNWIHNEPFILVGYYERTRHLVPYIKEGMVYGLKTELFSVTEEGNYISKQWPTRSLRWPAASEPVICRKKAEFVGRWLAAAGDVHTVYSIFGVQP
jgi:hypothetical protein